MKQTISFITLGVRDLARSRAFYRALGWRNQAAARTLSPSTEAGSVAFALFGREALAEDASVPNEGSGFPAFTLAHNVASEATVDATLAEAAAGGQFVRPANARGAATGLFRRPRRFPVGSLLQPLLRAG